MQVLLGALGGWARHSAWTEERVESGARVEQGFVKSQVSTTSMAHAEQVGYWWGPAPGGLAQGADFAENAFVWMRALELASAVPNRSGRARLRTAEGSPSVKFGRRTTDSRRRMSL